MKFETERAAAIAWTDGFNAVPISIVEKLMRAEEELYEVTPPAVGDRCLIIDDEHWGEHGEVVASGYDGEDDLYEIHVDGSDENIILAADEFDIERDSFLPMWGTMWAFESPLDNDWLHGWGGLQKMADCGFRIYEQEDYGYIFGIDGAGYDFCGAHWIPLYRERGLKWHDARTEDSKYEKKNFHPVYRAYEVLVKAQQSPDSDNEIPAAVEAAIGYLGEALE